MKKKERGKGETLPFQKSYRLLFKLGGDLAHPIDEEDD